MIIMIQNVFSYYRLKCIGLLLVRYIGRYVICARRCEISTSYNNILECDFQVVTIGLELTLLTISVGFYLLGYLSFQITTVTLREVPIYVLCPL